MRKRSLLLITPEIARQAVATLRKADHLVTDAEFADVLWATLVAKASMRRRHPRFPGQPSITCPTCRMTSYNPNDVRYRYCGNCHEFHDQMPGIHA